MVTAFAALYVQARLGVDPETIEELRLAYPVARHPMVRTHPDTGGEMLYVNGGFGKYVEGLEPEASNALLQHLYAHATNPEYQCFFKCHLRSINALAYKCRICF